MASVPSIVSASGGLKSLSKTGISLGKRGEDLACDYLKGHGLKIIQRNYRQKSGEIDIVCRDQSYIVFVEVKTRKSLRYGLPYEAVTKKKQAQISRVALDYLTRHKCLNHAVRFDVVSIVITNNSPADIEHLKDCFDAIL